MDKSYIEFLKNIRDDSYKLGYLEGIERSKVDSEKRCDMLKNEYDVLLKRMAWLQDKLARTKKNYDGQVRNLQKKIDYYEEILHRGDFKNEQI